MLNSIKLESDITEGGAFSYRLEVNSGHGEDTRTVAILFTSDMDEVDVAKTFQIAADCMVSDIAGYFH